ncbi:hypothetical protein MMC14_001591 [Varicellaria rhodocarpa]|nr:hypothetical protein [Varicellaria rhodocarpa]
MADYNKLTVIKLKEELKNRGLPQTGLKAVLVARLTEADAQHEPDTTTVEDDGDARQEGPEEELTPNGDDLNEATATQEAADTKDESLAGTKDGAESPGVKESFSAHFDGVVESTENAISEGEELRESPRAEDGTANNDAPEASQSEEALKTSPPATLEDSAAITVPSSEPEITLPEDKESRTELETSELPTGEVEPYAISTQTSINKEEVLEDTRKRKRRSQSPPPSASEGALKKAKALDGSPRVRLPEDTTVEEVDEGPITEVPTQVSIVEDGRDEAKAEVEEDLQAPEAVEPSKEEAPDDAQNGQPQQNSRVDDDALIDAAKGTPQLSDAEVLLSPTKASPTDTRFKNLFSVPPKQSGTPPRQDAYVDVEDRSVPPAMHPATPALYIRNFMRPLNPNNLKDHLTALAKAGHSSPSEETIHEFFLDTIRTHCLVQFSNVSAASRVRSALHDRVWPDEKIRKPLWVDFIPEDKIFKWIQVEQGSSNTRGQPAKRWEVVYEQEGGSMTAYLQEADQAGGALRGGVSTTTRDEVGRGVQGAPVGPRGSDSRQMQRAAPRADGGKGFKALDDLFQSTAAKPKLYFLPVAKPVAERRLNHLAAGRGGGRSDEMRKYTFEEGILVDRGPEYGYGRGGHRGRGAGFGPGNSDRGGGYRGGDSWRGRR